MSFDLADPEANKRATAEGYTVIGGGSMSAGEWENARRANAIQSAGRVTPTPKPYSDDPTAPPVEVVDHTADSALNDVVTYCTQIGELLIGPLIKVRVVRLPSSFAATYGNHTLDLNLNRLGRTFFVQCSENEPGMIDKLHTLLIHEYAHEWSTDHLDAKFHEQCCKLGARLIRLALKNNPVLTRGLKK